MRIILSIFFSLVISVMSVMAVPAYRKPFVVKQSDGSELTVVLTGDEALHYYVTLDGKPLVKEANGDYSYATFSNSGFFVSTKHLAHNIGSRSAAEKDLLLSIDNEEMNVRISKTAVSRSAKYNSAAERASSQVKPEGEVNVAVLLVQFKDTKFTYTKQDVENVFNTENFVYENPIANSLGSARDYFIAQSDGKFRPYFLVTDIVTLDNVMSYYGANNAGGDDKRPTHMIKEGIAKADANFDFSLCDNDGDGEVEFVYCIYAGYSESYGADENTIWPHKWQLSAQSGSITIDGVKCDTYACSSELILNETYEENYGKMLNGIGTVCHEFSHCLGLPDVYDVTYETNNFCMDYWDLMDQGNYAAEGYVPVGYSAYQRDFCGWRDLVELTSGGKYSMDALTQGGIGYKIINDANPKEYYILENRKQEGWDSYLFNSGMLVVHVDYLESAWKNNEINTTKGHPRYTIIPADNELYVYDPNNVEKFKSSMKADVWPGTTGNTKLTNTSIPAAKVYKGEYMNKPVTNIKYENNVISFTFIENSDWIFDVNDGVNTLVGYNGNDTEIILPDNYNGEKYVIGTGVFENNVTITKVTIPNSVTSIGEGAFKNCSGLTSVVIGNSVTSIGDEAFYRCSGLTSVIIGNSVTSIGSYAFKDCSGLTSVVIPNSITSIGEGAFKNCSELKTVINLSSLTITKGSSSNGYVGYYAETLINAPNGSIEGDFVFGKPNGVNTLIAYWGNETEIVLPENYKGANYAISADVFKGKTSITSVVIGNSVTSIGNSAFYGCSGLTSVVIGNSVTSIGSYAFKDCSELTSVVIPNSVTSIGEGAFKNCSGLTSVVIGNSVTSIGSYAFENCSGLTSIEIPNSVTSIGSGAFSGCSGLTSIEIPNSVTSIGSVAFYNCSGLNSIEIPNNVTSIGGGAFYGCSGLTSVVIPNSVTSIGSYAFENCSGLKSVVIGNSVTSIGNSAFSGCSGFTSVVVAEGNAKYDSRENCNAIIEKETNTLVVGCKNTIIPNSVASIGERAFYNCSGLNSIVIPNSVTSIGDNAFENCSGLASVVIPNSMTSIGSYAFYYCRRLTSIVIGNSVTSIGSYAFWNCTGLTSVVIGNSVTSIGSSAFWSCSGLKTVINLSSLAITKGSASDGYVGYYAEKVINAPNGSIEGDFVFGKPNGVNTLVAYLGNDTKIILPENYKGENYAIGDNVFKDNTTITSIAIPSSVTGFGNDVFYGCTGLTAVYIHDLTSWCNIDFANYSANPLVRAKNLCLNGETVTELVIPDNISEIKQYTFLNCSTLTKVTIPGSVTTIGNYAFSGCVELADVTIPNSVTSIGSYAFSYCSGLTSVVIGNSVTSIGSYAFSYCSGLTSVVIGNSVTSIGECAFQNCTSLAEIIIPNSVTEIGDKAFFECKNLKSVINCSELIIEKGSVDNGMVGFYADEIINLPNGFIEGDFGFAVIDGVNTLVGYFGNDTDIVLPESYKGENYVIGDNVFKDNTTITSIAIPSSVTGFGDEAFYGCSGLTAVYIEDLTTWCNMEFATPESNPLYYAKNLYLHGEVVTELVVPGNVSVVKQYAFYNCSGITDIVIPNSVTSIGNSAFTGCSKAKELYLGNSIESIGDNAFAGCNGLLEIRNSSIIAIECNENIFSNNTYNNAKLYVPEGRKEFYENVTPWNKFFFTNELTSTDYLFAITYMVDDKAYYTYALKQNEAVPSPQITKEGCVFEGWEGLPELMPGEDIFVYALFSVKCYNVTFVVDGKEYEIKSVEYGKEITLPEPPEKEGHTFVGWSEVPETMPAEDITIEAIFTVNSYLVTFFVDGEKYHEESVEFATKIPLVEEPVKVGYIFSGWRNVPQTMPARDLDIHGTFFIADTGIEEMKEEMKNEKVEIYNLKGERFINKENLPEGIYIINGRKILVK